MLHSAIFFNEQYLAIYGGKSDAIYKETKNLALNDLWLFDIANNKWDSIVMYGYHPCSRWGHTMCSLGKNQMIIFGGVNLQSYCRSSIYLLNTDLKSLKGFLKRLESLNNHVKSKLKILEERK